MKKEESCRGEMVVEKIEEVTCLVLLKMNEGGKTFLQE